LRHDEDVMAVYAEPKFLLAGDCAVTVELADEISPEINTKIRALGVALDRERVPGIVDLVPTYRSLLVYYDPMQLRLPELKDRILNLAHVEEAALPAPRVLHIPTRYGGDHGPDMDFVSRHTGLSADEVAAIHASTDYLVYMMGFNTGFPYLGGMSAQIAAPRLETPRTVVPAGSVAIAQQQTGIYPVESPGGWRLIGRSPVRLFDPRREPPVAVEAGDYLRFVPIDDAQYRDIEAQVTSGTYHFVVTEKRM
jgi:KipI family sensor histidine kinase inhibitor